MKRNSKSVQRAISRNLIVRMKYFSKILCNKCALSCGKLSFSFSFVFFSFIWFCINVICHCDRQRFYWRIQTNENDEKQINWLEMFNVSVSVQSLFCFWMLNCEIENNSLRKKCNDIEHLTNWNWKWRANEGKWHEKKHCWCWYCCCFFLRIKEIVSIQITSCQIFHPITSIYARNHRIYWSTFQLCTFSKWNPRSIYTKIKNARIGIKSENKSLVTSDFVKRNKDKDEKWILDTFWNF